MDIRETEQLISEVYDSLDDTHKARFRNHDVIGGCHCIPPTEWYGDMFLAFTELLQDHAVRNTVLEERIRSAVSYLSQWFSV